jgi:hypothetical protein
MLDQVSSVNDSHYKRTWITIHVKFRGCSALNQDVMENTIPAAVAGWQNREDENEKISSWDIFRYHSDN